MTSQTKKNLLPSVYVSDAGRAGEAAILKYRNITTIVAVLDNNAAKQGTMLCAYIVIAPAEISKSSFDKILITSDIKPLKFENSESVRLQAETVLATTSLFFIERAFGHYIDTDTFFSGVIRDGELMSCEDLIDFAVSAAELGRLLPALPKLTRMLESETGIAWSFEVFYSPVEFHVICKRDVRSIDVYCIRSDARMLVINLPIKYIAERRIFYILVSRELEMPAHFIDNITVRKSKSMLVVVPNDAEPCLSSRYGKIGEFPREIGT